MSHQNDGVASTIESARSRPRRLRSAMTLTQMLVAVVIVGVLLAVAIPLYSATKKSAQTRGCEANLAAIFQAEEAYRVRNRAYTATAGNLAGTLGPLPICPSGSNAYTITVAGSGASQTVTIQCNNTGAHIASQNYATSDGITFTGVGP